MKRIESLRQLEEFGIVPLCAGAHKGTVTINARRYLDPKSGQWKDAASYQPSDLPALLFCLAKAQEYCYETPIPGQEDAEIAASDGGVGDRF